MFPRTCVCWNSYIPRRCTSEILSLATYSFRPERTESIAVSFSHRMETDIETSNRPDEWKIEQGLASHKLPILDQTGRETVFLHPQPKPTFKDEVAIAAIGDRNTLFAREREGWKGYPDPPLRLLRQPADMLLDTSSGRSIRRRRKRRTKFSLPSPLPNRQITSSDRFPMPTRFSLEPTFRNGIMLSAVNWIRFRRILGTLF